MSFSSIYEVTASSFQSFTYHYVINSVQYLDLFTSTNLWVWNMFKLLNSSAVKVGRCHGG